jgi:hypothetical protein
MKAALKNSENGCAEGGSKWSRIRWPIETKQLITGTQVEKYGP